MTGTELQTVYIIDDDAGVRDSVSELVESVGLKAQTYSSGRAFLDAIKPQSPGCLVLDIRMPEMGGLALMDKFKELGYTIPVIILTGHADVSLAVRAMKAGAVNLIQKPYHEQTLLDSINDALALDAVTRQTLPADVTIDTELATLTEREREVYNRILEGATSKQIGRDLGISHRTVEAHRQNLLRKLAVGSVKTLILRRVSQLKSH
jgi:two-component system, LuxR family, response regulator FixJ